MDERTALDLARQVRAFLEVAEQAIQLDRSDAPLIADVVTEHLGAPADTLAPVSLLLPAYEQVNAHRALEWWSAPQRQARLIGMRTPHPMSLGDALQSHRWGAPVTVATPRYTRLDTGPDDHVTALEQGLCLAHGSGGPVVVGLFGADPHHGREQLVLEVLALEPEQARTIVDELRTLLDEVSVFRGQVLSLEGQDLGMAGAGPLRFHARPRMTQADLVLPEGVLDRVTRHVVGVAAHRDQLRATGLHLKRGMLLHGAPGTGKTHTVRYLLSQLPDVTTILLAGETLRFISAACDLARRFQPSMVVLEDCDLVAEDRSFTYGPQPLLFQVLNELDGLDNDADVAFLLTSNRVEVLERALVERPGRVDEAVEIPLPDDDGRRRLLALYTRGLGEGAEVERAVDDVVRSTSGVTASFLREIGRRAALLCALEDGASASIRPEPRHLIEARDELMAARSDLAARLLGGGRPLRAQ